LEIVMATRRVKLELLMGADPAITTILKTAPGGHPALVGRGSVSHVCPKCDAVLCKGVAAARLRHLVFLCECGALGRVAQAEDSQG
jgi:hypothetical protein